MTLVTFMADGRSPSDDRCRERERRCCSRQSGKRCDRFRAVRPGNRPAARTAACRPRRQLSVIAALLAQFCKQSRALTLAKIRSCATSGTGSHTAVAATHRSGS
jgi:hypothetical protein